MANPLVLTDWTTILNEGAIGANATLPTFAAGSNRIAVIAEIYYNGAGNTQASTTVSANSVTPSNIAVPGAAQTRVTVAFRCFLESQLASVTGQVYASSGGTGSQKSIAVLLLKDCPQIAPTGAMGYASASGAIPVSLARAANSLTIGLGFTSVSSTTLTSTNPATASALSLTSGRRVSYGSQNDTANTSNFNTTGQNYTATAVFNVAELALQTIDTVNGGTDTIPLGSAFTWITSNFSPAPNAATLGGISCTGVSGTGGTAPGLVDGATLPELGAQTLTGSNGSQSASRSQTVTAPTGYISQLLSGTLDTSQYSCLYNMSPAAVAGDRIFAPDANGNILYSDGTFKTDLTGTQTWWHRQASTGIVRSFPVITSGQSNVITITRTLSAKTLTAKTLTARSL